MNIITASGHENTKRSIRKELFHLQFYNFASSAATFLKLPKALAKNIEIYSLYEKSKGYFFVV